MINIDEKLSDFFYNPEKFKEIIAIYTSSDGATTINNHLIPKYYFNLWKNNKKLYKHSLENGIIKKEPINLEKFNAEKHTFFQNTESKFTQLVLTLKSLETFKVNTERVHQINTINGALTEYKDIKYMIHIMKNLNGKYSKIFSLSEEISSLIKKNIHNKIINDNLEIETMLYLSSIFSRIEILKIIKHEKYLTNFGNYIIKKISRTKNKLDLLLLNHVIFQLLVPYISIFDKNNYDDNHILKITKDKKILNKVEKFISLTKTKDKIFFLKTIIKIIETFPNEAILLKKILSQELYDYNFLKKWQDFRKFDFLIFYNQNMQLPTTEIPIIESHNNKYFFHALSPQTLIIFGTPLIIRNYKKKENYINEIINEYYYLINKSNIAILKK